MSGDLSDVNYLSKQMELLCREMEAAGVPRPIISPINSSKGQNLSDSKCFQHRCLAAKSNLYPCHPCGGANQYLKN